MFSIEAESYAPVATDPYRPNAGSLPRQLVQSQTRKVHILWLSSRIEKAAYGSRGL